MDLYAWIAAYPRLAFAGIAVLLVIVIYQGYKLGWYTSTAAAVAKPKLASKTAGAPPAPAPAATPAAPKDEIKELTDMVNS